MAILASLVLMDEQFNNDPGIKTIAGTLATARVWQPAGNWRARFGGDAAGASWSYISNAGPAEGIDETHAWNTYVRHYFELATVPSANLGALVGFHSNPAGASVPDKKNFMGYRVNNTSGVNLIFQACAYDKDGVISLGSSLVWGTGSENNFRCDVSYNPSTRLLSLILRSFSTLAILGTSSVTLPVGFEVEPMMMFGSRDGPDGSAVYGLDGYLDNLSIAWTNPPDDWLLHARGYGVALLGHAATWNKSMVQRDVIIEALGRQWNNTYHDGAAGIEIELSGTLQRDLPTYLDYIGEMMSQIRIQGLIVDLYPPSSELMLTLKNAKVIAWRFPRQVARLDNRDFRLVVRNRRKPEIT